MLKAFTKIALIAGLAGLTFAPVAAAMCGTNNPLIDWDLTTNGAPPFSDGKSCDAGGLSFNDFTLVTAGGYTGIEISATPLLGATVDLRFNFALTPATGDNDFEFSYIVDAGNGLLTGVDLNIGGGAAVFTGDLAIIENVFGCLNDDCTEVTQAAIAQISVDSSIGKFFDEQDFAQGWKKVLIIKDVNVGETMSSFTNSHHIDRVPEPAALLLLGTGLLGLGLIARRKR